MNPVNAVSLPIEPSSHQTCVVVECRTSEALEWLEMMSDENTPETRWREGGCDADECDGCDECRACPTLSFYNMPGERVVRASDLPNLSWRHEVHPDVFVFEGSTDDGCIASEHVDSLPLAPLPLGVTYALVYPSFGPKKEDRRRKQALCEKTCGAPFGPCEEPHKYTFEVVTIRERGFFETEDSALIPYTGEPRTLEDAGETRTLAEVIRLDEVRETRAKMGTLERNLFDKAHSERHEMLSKMTPGEREKLFAEEAREKREAVEAAKLAEVSRDRPEIIVQTNELYRIVDEAAQSLSRHPALYVRLGKLARVGRLGSTLAKVEGAPNILQLSDASLKEELTRVAVWKTWKAKSEKELASERKGSPHPDKVAPLKLVPCPPPDDVVAALAKRGRYPLPEIAGVIESPVMRPDGTIVQAPGYDSATGYYFAPGDTVFPPVPDAPTQEDASKALAILADTFVDFPFVGVGRSVPIAHTLTLLARPAVEGCTPVFCYDAPTRGSGKTLAADVACLIATGRPSSIKVYPREDEEIRKVIDGYALAATPSLTWDNVPSGTGFGSGAIDATLTGTTVMVRVLGKTGEFPCDWRTVMSATGNNFAFRGDTSRRAAIARLESSEENPENRNDYRYPERKGVLKAWVLENRPALVVAALTVLRGYFAAGRPKQKGCEWGGGFEAWADLIAGAIVWAEGENPCKARPDDSDAGVDHEKDALRAIVAGWPKAPDGDWLTTAELLASKTVGLLGRVDPDFQGAIDDLVQPRPGLDPKRALGKALAKLKGRPVDGVKLAGTKHPTKNVAAWRLESVKGAR